MEKFIDELNNKKIKNAIKSNENRVDATTSAQLRVPLQHGWKRETIFENVSREFEIEGEVYYYSPGSLRKLRSIEEVEKVR